LTAYPIFAAGQLIYIDFAGPKEHQMCLNELKRKAFDEDIPPEIRIAKEKIWQAFESISEEVFLCKLLNYALALLWRSVRKSKKCPLCQPT
jgi:hypothetical protein